jgi:uncharacterized protein YidB (DUF937 family)
LSKPRLDEKENVTMSGFIGQILGNMMGGQQAGQPAAIAGILQRLLAANGGGVASVVSRFEAAGLGSNAQSWVSTGENQPVSADQIGKVFSPEQINAWSTQAGTTPEKMCAVLAEALPHAVDHVTPGGQVPAPDAIPDLSSLVSRFFNSGAR